MRLGCEWRHARKRWVENFGDFEKKQWVEIRNWARPVEIWSWMRRVQFVAYGMRHAFVGSDGTVSIVKNCVALSSCRKPKSQEGNKSFVPELKRVVSVSEFLCMWRASSVVLWYVKYTFIAITPQSTLTGIDNTISGLNRYLLKLFTLERSTWNPYL